MFEDNADLHEQEEPAFRGMLRIGVAVLIILAAIAAACIVMVPAGQAEVITRFGNPIRIITEPGLAWKLPAPFESAIPIDLRLITTSTGLQDVGTRDGLRVLVQAYVAWQVPSDPQQIRQFLRSVRNEPTEAARQLRQYVNADMGTISTNFNLSDLVNKDPQNVRLDAFEDQLRAQIAPRMSQVYGIAVRQIGIERMTLPDETLAATVQRMKAERETVAAQATADGNLKASAIRSDAEKEARVIVTEANAKAARTEADAQKAAAATYARASQADPGLYEMVRSLDAISQTVSPSTNIILRTDAFPLRVLVDGPPGANTAPRPGQASASPSDPAKTPAPAKDSAPLKSPTKDGKSAEVAKQ